jgi:AraC-like DNA-binding protein
VDTRQFLRLPAGIDRGYAKEIAMGVFLDITQARLTNVGSPPRNGGWVAPAHSHPQWEFVYFFRGSGRVKLPEASFHPQQFHLMIYPPHLIHTEKPDPVDPQQTIFFTVDLAWAPPVRGNLLLPDQSGAMCWLCRQIEAEYLTAGITPLADAYTRCFLHLLERAWESAVVQPEDFIAFTVQYLHANFHHEITIAMLAQAVRVSETYLMHQFTARMGCSIMRYLQQVRLDAARQLLATTGYSIQTIALRVGYPDPLYFSRVFSRVMGESPTAFRQRVHCTGSSISITDSSIAVPPASALSWYEDPNRQASVRKDVS